MSRHRQKIRNYVFDVARDMLSRGTIRRRRGEIIEDVVRREAATVAGEVWEDVLSVFTELGFHAKAGLDAAARSRASDLAGGVVEWGFNKLAEMIVKKR